MPKTMHVQKRYRIILNILRKPGQYSSKDIHQSCVNTGLCVSHRTIQKDLEDLRDDHTIFNTNIGIAHDRHTKRWYATNIPKNIYSSLKLEEEEINALLFYAKTISQYRDYPLFSKITTAVQKVIDNSNIAPETKLLFENTSILETEKHFSVPGIEMIIELLVAINNNKVVKISYQKFNDGQPNEHVIKPVLLKEDKKLWYILGISNKYQKLTTYALDRINDLVVTEEVFESIPFNSEEYFKHSFGITVTEEDPVEVIISFRPDQGNYLKTLSIHPTQKIITDSSEKFIISVKVRPSYEFFSKIFSYGNMAIIISPPEIRAKFLSSFEKAVINYR